MLPAFSAILRAKQTSYGESLVGLQIGTEEAVMEQETGHSSPVSLLQQSFPALMFPPL